MKRNRRLLAGLLVGLCFALVWGINTPVARADDPITLSQAKAQLTTLRAQVDDIETQLANSEDVMNQALVLQAQLQTDIANQQAAIDAMTPAIAEMVNAQRQGSPWQATITFLLNDDVSQFIDHIGVTASVQLALNEQMARLTDKQQQLAATNQSLDDTIAAAQAQVDQQQALLAQQQAAEAQAQKLVAQLTPSQRASLPSGLVTPQGRPQTVYLVQLIEQMFPQITDVGTVRAGGGDHAAGLAADFMIPNYQSNVALGWQIAQYVQANAKALRVHYIIWQQSIWNIEVGGGWRHMANRGSDTANHINHVHVSLYT